MPAISYNLGIPASGNDPSFDQPLMKINNDNIATYLSVDHVPFDVNNSGYHTVIHEVPNGVAGTTDPATIAGINQVYAKNVTITNSAGTVTDTQLFTITGLGGISQLTGYHAAANGFQFLGGLILQYGFVAAPGVGIGTVLFNQAPNFDFPTACYGVWFTSTPAGGNLLALANNPSNIQFNWATNDGYGAPAFYWIAIGS